MTELDALAVPHEPWPSIPRSSRVTYEITEKIDGTNALVHVSRTPPALTPGVEVALDGEPAWVRLGSRNRWLWHDQDNHGFFAWAHGHAQALATAFGLGAHHGEWYGAGIGRRYGLASRRLAMFRPRPAAAWEAMHAAGLPSEVHSVPLLARLTLDEVLGGEAARVVAALFAGGSVAVPGFPSPEGVVVRGPGDARMKITDNGNMPKWAFGKEA